jgi:uncharacterized transporter YbjL
MKKCIINGVMLLFAVLAIVLGYLKLYYGRPIVTTQASGLVKHFALPISNALDERFLKVN